MQAETIVSGRVGMRSFGEQLQVALELLLTLRRQLLQELCCGLRVPRRLTEIAFIGAAASTSAPLLVHVSGRGRWALRAARILNHRLPFEQSACAMRAP